MPRYQFIKRALYAAGLLDQPFGAVTSTQLSTAYGLNVIMPFKTTGTIIPGRVVKITSSGTVKHTTGSSGRQVIGVAVTSGATAQILLRGFVRVISSSAALAKGARLVASSGSVQTSRYKGGCARALNTGIGTSVSHGFCFGYALSSAAASSGTTVATNKKVLIWFEPMGRISTGV